MASSSTPVIQKTDYAEDPQLKGALTAPGLSIPDTIDKLWGTEQMHSQRLHRSLVGGAFIIGFGLCTAVAGSAESSYAPSAQAMVSQHASIPQPVDLLLAALDRGKYSAARMLPRANLGPHAQLRPRYKVERIFVAPMTHPRGHGIPYHYPGAKLHRSYLATLPPNEPGRRATQSEQLARGLVHRLQSASQTSLRAHGAVHPLAMPHPSQIGRGGVGQTVVTESSNFTGINAWWTYEEEPIPGVGKDMVNVATGNLIVQSDDLSLPHRGLAYAFRRTYNGFSQHDYSGTDGSMISNYGGGWTNSFDARIAHNDYQNNNGLLGISVFDIDGARYDYQPSASGTPTNPGCYVAPPGQFATLCADSGGGDDWTKESGTVYHFMDLKTPPPGAQGRITEIFGRNDNTYLSFVYAFDSGSQNLASNLLTLTVTSDGGNALTLNYSDVSTRGGTERLLSSLVSFDGQTITYQYNADGNLAEVDAPGPNNTGVLAKQRYAYNNTAAWPHQLYQITTPNWIGSSQTQGSYITYVQDPVTNETDSITPTGWLNPAPADGIGTATPMWSNLQNVVMQGATDSFSYPSQWPTGNQTAPTTVTDSDNHSRVYTWDADGRVVKTIKQTGATSLTTKATWDAASNSNNLLETVDARGNATDYAYDNNGNAVGVALPNTGTTEGTMRPVSWYRVDAYNNIVAYCDAEWSSRNNVTWPQASPSTVCPNSHGSPSNPGAEQQVWANPAAEPYGQLTDSYSFLGYHTSYTYTSFGQIHVKQGDTINEADGTQWNPTETFGYDGYGNLNSYNKGNGAWTLLYNAGNQPTQITDPDGYASMKYYYPDETLYETQTPAQVDYGVQTQMTYDLDGNELTVLHHYGNTPGTTNKFYDGLDRLVEVVGATSSGDGSIPATRNLYDLSLGGTDSNCCGATITGYGNLVISESNLAGVWTEKNAKSFDGLDRDIAEYTETPTACCNAGAGALTMYAPPSVMQTATKSYDATPGTLGLLSSATDPLGEVKTYSYFQPENWLAGISYSVPQGSGLPATPALTYKYNPDGHKGQLCSGVFGCEYDTYDADSRLSTVVEENGNGVTSPANPITYGYYGNGTRASVSISSAGFNQTNAIQYSYRNDGKLKTETTHVGTGGSITRSYSNAGRLAHSGTLDSLSVGYDSDGHVLSMQTPGGSMTNAAYDAEDEITGANLTPTSGTAIAPTILYNSRGMISFVDANVACNPHSQINPPYANSYSYAFGWWVNHVQNRDSLCQTQATALADPLNGLTLQRTGGGGASPPSSTGSSDAWGYDADMRQTTHSHGDWGVVQGYGPHGSKCWGQMQSVATRKYDAENHLVSQQLTGSSSLNIQTVCANAASPTQLITIGWGANGHPLQIVNSGASGTTTYTLHWDQDVLLFVTDNTGATDDFKVGTDADIPLASTNTVMPLDRWVDGAAFASPVNSQFNIADPRDDCTWLTGTAIGEGGAFFNPTFPYVRTDGFNVVGGCPYPMAPQTAPVQDAIRIQGGRNFDSYAAQWTTPDAFAGDPSAPVSQMKFMYNNENSVSYSDPSGFDPYVIFDEQAAQGNGHVRIAIIRHGDTIGTVYSEGPAHDGMPVDRLVVSKQTIRLADIAKLILSDPMRYTVGTEHTTDAQDAAMMKEGDARVEAAQNNPFALYSVGMNNCDQFVGDVLGKGDPRTVGAFQFDPFYDMVHLLGGWYPGFESLKPEWATQVWGTGGWGL